MATKNDMYDEYPPGEQSQSSSLRTEDERILGTLTIRGVVLVASESGGDHKGKMHFVKKVPTTAEEKAAREKLRSAKLRAYCTMRDKVFDKRTKEELDEELLELTATLLSKNPDVYTFWNIRRSAIQNLLNKREADESDEAVRKRNDSILGAELPLTEQCLMENPKSYGAWFQRGWALGLMKERDLERELKTTEKALQMDARNFHCWDHRRLVVQLAGITPQQELKFSERMINANFSNYSAWHYRSTLLPLVGPSSSDTPLDDETIASELKRLANAFFTDPEDQSAWKYTEWLINMDTDNTNERISNKVLSVTLYDSNRSAVVVLTGSVSEHDVRTMVTFPSIDQQFITCSPVSLYPRSKYSRVFVMSASSDMGRPEISQGDIIEDNGRREGYIDREAIYKALNIHKRCMSTARQKALNSVIDNCNALIDEMAIEKTEQLNKWPLLTVTRCLIELDAVGNHEQIINNLGRLSKELDPQRERMYQDMGQHFRLNAHLRSVREDGRMVIDELIASEGHMVLRNMQLTSMIHLQPLAGLITTLNLSGNSFDSLHSFAVFPRLTSLTLDENPISSLVGLKRAIPRVEFLSLASTAVAKPQDIAQIVESTALRRLVICETPLAADDQLSREVYKLVEEKGCDIRLIRHWL